MENRAILSTLRIRHSRIFYKMPMLTNLFIDQ